MLLYDKCGTKLSEAPELFPRRPEPLVPEKIADALQSRVMNGFEAAVDEGMQPMEALSVILRWVSSEMRRTKPDRNASSF